MAKANFGTALIKELKLKGWQESDSTLHAPGSPEALKIISDGSKTRPKGRSSLKSPVLKSGWIDDTRNLKNKAAQTDLFMKLIKEVFHLEVWPEFYFTTERDFRFDYAIPVNLVNTELKIAIEVEGGIWLKGKSGHSSGTGIQRDMDKSSLANVHGWTLIRRTPDQLMTNETLDLIRRAIELKK